MPPGLHSRAPARAPGIASYALLAVLLVAPAGARAWGPCPRPRPLERVTPAAAEVDPSLLGDLDALLHSAVAERVTQSAVAVVMRRGKLLYLGAAGGARPDSIFDVASLTKVVATAPAVLQLRERGKIGLGRSAARYLPLLRRADKRAVTVDQLLLHTSGLPSVVWAGAEGDGLEQILGRIGGCRVGGRPGARFKYSDIGFILLGQLVRQVSGAALDRYVAAKLHRPLGMCDTGFAPPTEILRRVVSPWPAGGKAGQVYDPLAARMGGVAGHAGLYSTATDLARFGQMLLEEGALGGQRVLRPTTVREMLRPRALPGAGAQRRALGWDVASPTGSTTARLSPRAFGHTGFTGTSLWIDPAHELVLVLLTNRTWREPAPSVVPLRRRFHDLVIGALDVPPRRPIRTGLDALVQSGFRQLRGRRVAVITNASAVDRRGKWIVDLLLDAPEVKVEALFAPEHGLEGRLDRHIRDRSVARGGRRVPVYSLYGDRRRPTDATLRGVDTLLFDVALVGVRYYTYIATMGWAMEEAANRKLRFIVLDRPNPLGGEAVQGPVSVVPKPRSTNYHPLPVRYGMTTGELARMLNRERKIGAELEVIRLAGWDRARTFNHLGLPWINPSPNIRSYRQALLYAGVGLVEGTNVAVGRGTASPFQVVGAPWLDGAALARLLNAQRIAGVHAVPTSFTPSSSRHRGKRCAGVRLLLTDPGAIDPVALGVALAAGLRRLHPENWDARRLGRLVQHPPTTRAILAGKPLREILPLWRRELTRFRRVRQRYLLY